MDAAAIDRTLFEQVPFAQHVGAHVSVVDAESAEAILPAAQERLNHVGTVHAVAQFGLGEVASGGLVLAAFSDLMAEGYAPIAAAASITYVRPGRGDLRAVSQLSRADQDTVRAQVAEWEAIGIDTLVLGVGAVPFHVTSLDDVEMLGRACSS